MKQYWLYSDQDYFLIYKQILHVEVKFLSSIYHFLKSYTDTVICFTAKQKHKAKISGSEFANAAKVQKTENRDVGY